ncbi:hypothetical protein PsYK624_103600 [Phanerochaete sordida]|uniref:Uncharacterized protein n=1 Tax=Phanerochaete sordida TaxID=48140 RepID=A0A9P3GEG3_9APHY|nr:hypothetical protein PsYK624_103600 [Phanerochaete sordida]
MNALLGPIGTFTYATTTCRRSEYAAITPEHGKRSRLALRNVMFVRQDDRSMPPPIAVATLWSEGASERATDTATSSPRRSSAGSLRPFLLSPPCLAAALARPPRHSVPPCSVGPRSKQLRVSGACPRCPHPPLRALQSPQAATNRDAEQHLRAQELARRTGPACSAPATLAWARTSSCAFCLPGRGRARTATILHSLR